MTGAANGSRGAPDGPERCDEIHLLVGACGAGALLVLPDYLMSLSAQGFRVRVVMTHTATRMLPPQTVRLACQEVYTDGSDQFAPGHVALTTWANRLIVLPATAHVLGQAAYGLAGGLLGTILLAYENPVFFFPSMNLRMWRNAAVRRNVAQLRADGHHVVEPVMRRCWEIATGTFQVGPGLPSAAEVARLVREVPAKTPAEAPTEIPADEMVTGTVHATADNRKGG